MELIDYSLLENPVWNSLTTIHSPLAIGTDSIVRYRPQTLQLFGCKYPSSANVNDLSPWVMPAEIVYMIGALCKVPSNWFVSHKMDCIQMVCPEVKLLADYNTAHIVELTEDDIDNMLYLTNLVNPGFFFKNTPLLGNYYGIKQNNQLVAMAGERLCLQNFTEVSAVCTHPQFTGRGYARQLVAHVSRINIHKGVIPFLHYAMHNVRARNVYEQVGFIRPKPITFWGITKKAD